MRDGKTLVRSELERLPLSLDSLSDEIFDFTEDPAASLDAHLPELRYTSLRQGYTAAALENYASAYRVQVKNNEHAGIEYAAIPTWYLGLPKSKAGPNVYITGWSSLEVNIPESYRIFLKSFNAMPLG